MPQLLRRPAMCAALATFFVLLLVSGRYGYHRDELYFLQAGRHLAWGYPDQPPLVPLLARLTGGSDSLVLLRLPATIAAALVVLLAGLSAERLGAHRSGQWLATSATALCGVVLGPSHLLSTATFALLGSMTIGYLVLRVLQGGDRRLWWLVGVVGGVTFQANPLVGFLLVMLFLVSRRSGALVAGLIALVIGLPYIVWQADHGWPQLDVARNIAHGGSVTSVSRGLFLVFLVLQVGPWLLPVWAVGLRRLLRDSALRPLGMAFIGLTILFLGMGGKPYYLAGLIPLLLAAGAQPVADRLPRWATVTLVALSTPVIIFTLPILPESQAANVLAVNPDAAETIGWPSFARQVASAVPPGAVVVTQNYGQAGALDRYTDLPVFSGHNGYTLWGLPPGSIRALTVGVPIDLLNRSCTDVREVAVIRSPHGISNHENGTTLRLCTPKMPWAQLWPAFSHLG